MVDRFLEDNLAGAVSIDDVARLATMSKRNLSRQYRKETNLSVGEKLAQLRMYKAEELLRETDLQIKAIAQRVGISDTHYFARKFKEFYGWSPSEHRLRVTVELADRPLTLLDADYIAKK